MEDAVNDNNDQPKPSGPQEAGVDPLPIVGDRTMRRRLMLGVGAAAALPSVSTFAGGSQTANSSTSACWSKHKDEGYSLPERVTSQPDGWLRKPVLEGKRKGDTAYCLAWEQGQAIQSLEGKAKPGSAWLVNNIRVVAGNPDAITGVSHHPRAYALVFVNGSGEQATLDPEHGKAMYPVQESCWTSMLGSKGSNLG